MKITLSPLVASMRGRAAHCVAVVSRGVQYVKSYGRPTGPPSAAQLAQRHQFSRLASWWRSLPDVIRTFLNVLGKERGMTGFALFTQVNASLQSPEYDPRILPENHFWFWTPWIYADPGMYPGDIDVTWNATTPEPDRWMHFFTTLLHFDDLSDYRPNHFRYHRETVVAVAGEYARLTNFELGLLYLIVAITSEHEVLEENTTFSGGNTARSDPGPPL